MRLRTAKDRLKVEHSIIDGVREILERVLAGTPEIRSIIPGVIRCRCIMVGRPSR
jgi:hypothetical protein